MRDPAYGLCKKISDGNMQHIDRIRCGSQPLQLLINQDEVETSHAARSAGSSELWSFQEMSSLTP